MAEEQDSTTADAGSTPGEQSVGSSTTTGTQDAFASHSDPWATIDQVEPAQPEQPEEPAKEPKAEPKPDGTAEPEEDKPIEDKILEEAFSDTPAADEPAGVDVDKQDPKAMAAAQSTVTAKAYLERAERVYTPAKQFKHGEIDADGFATKLAEFIGPDKAIEYARHEAHRLVDNNTEAAFRRAYAVEKLKADPNWDFETAEIPSLKDIVANGIRPAGEPPAPVAALPDLTELTADLDKTLEFDWRNESLDDDNFVDDREKLMAKTLRAVEAKAKQAAAEKEDIKQKFEAARTEIEAAKQGQLSEAQRAENNKLGEIIQTYRKSVEEKILPHILKNTGLEVSQNDTPEVAAYKKSRLELYTGTDYQRANGLDSPFEEFAYNESSVKKELDTVLNRIVAAQRKQAKAELAQDAKSAETFRTEADDERVSLYNLLAQASKEFSTKRIKPDLDLIGVLSTTLAAPIKEMSERKEVVSNGSGNGTQPARRSEARTAEDVWDNVVKEAEQDAALRANA